MQKERLDRAFFMTDALTLSKNLIGKILVHETSLGTVRAIITETEAYMGVEDKGSHTYGGKRTDRTEAMFHVGGTSYVYLIYGMYNCVNITAGKADVPMAALIRMVEPADETSKEIMEKLRMVDMQKRKEAREKRKEAEAKKGETKTAIKTAIKTQKLPGSIIKHLADGPGKLCIAMEITRAHNDLDLVTDKTFYVTEGIAVEESRIQTGKRIGIDYAEEAADYLWRFTLV